MSSPILIPSSMVVGVTSSTTVYPATPTQRSRWNMSVFDVATLSLQYIQKGLLFPKPIEPFDVVVERLKTSLSLVLADFFPLAGRFVDDHLTTTFVNCNDAGVLFVVASAVGLMVSDLIKGEIDVPDVVKSFFQFDGTPSYDGHSQHLVAIQVTELADGVFIGCSYNHGIGDGESFWHFFNSWSELCRSDARKPLSRPPILDRPILQPDIYKVENFHVKEYDIERHKSPLAPLLRERIFHFGPQMVARLKAKTNQSPTFKSMGEVSSLQAVTALMWRSITRARRIREDQLTKCRMAAGVRRRMQPPLSRDCVGNYVHVLATSTSVRDLLKNDLSWAANTLHEMVVKHTTDKVKDFMKDMLKEPRVFKTSNMFDPNTIMIGSSPRLEMYGSDFCWGRGLAVLSGSSNKFDGKISAYPGRDGGGSIDLEVCLYPHHMEALLMDQEFLDALHH